MAKKTSNEAQALIDSCMVASRAVDYVKLGHEIRTRREFEGLNLIDVAAAMQIDKSYLSLLESGQRNIHPDLVEDALVAIEKLREK